MAKTLAQLRVSTREKIKQSSADNGDYTQSELDVLINEAVKYCAVLAEWPKAEVHVQVTNDDPTYSLPSDFLIAIDVYFGDSDIYGDVAPLRIGSLQELKELYPNWIDSTDSSKGRPAMAVRFDRSTLLIHPRPDATESATGKKYHLYYVKYPAALSADSDTPDLPDSYHDLVPFWAAYLAYTGKVSDFEKAKQIKKEFLENLELIKNPVTRDYQNYSFYFSSEDRAFLGD